jgi:hypothetical protein
VDEQLDVFGDLAAPASDKQPQHSREGEIGEGKQHPLMLVGCANSAGRDKRFGILGGSVW